MDPAIEASSIETSRKIFGWNTIDVEFPSHPTVEHSLQVRRVKDGNFCQSKVYEYSLMFFGLRAITQFWEEELVATQYLVYAKQEFEKDGSAKVFAGWEIIPYKTIENTTPSENKGFAFFHKIVNSIRRIWQQCVVFYRIVFGALASSERELSAKKTFYSKLKEDFEELIDKSLIKTSNLNQDRTDAFCQQEVRDKQRVWKGQYGDGLVSYAPVGLGGERIHLLYVPDDHGDFDTLSENAYIEAMHFHN
ncbi:MAG: hypothetical protein ACXU9U_01340, partial [Parachlamydiaceae bacterium]